MQKWWGHYEVPPGRAFRFAVGPLELWIESRTREWRIATADAPEALDRFAIEGPLELSSPADAPVHRFATSPADQRVTLSPVPADRPIVVRPDPAVSVPPDETVTFYVSTPSWVEIVSSTGKQLGTFPSTRLSDTWFGASTMEGQLCYASRTAARLLLEALPVRPGRVRTAIEVRNQGRDRLLLERVQLP
ncbi:MAG: hypothetical protein AAF211_24905, partial [Myxococcota bacterium]